MSECISAAQKHQLLVHRPVHQDCKTRRTNLSTSPKLLLGDTSEGQGPVAQKKADTGQPTRQRCLTRNRRPQQWHLWESSGNIRKWYWGLKRSRCGRSPVVPMVMSIDRYGYLSGSRRFQEQHQRNLFGGVQLRPCVYTDVKWNSSLHDPSSKGKCLCWKTHFHQSEKYSNWMVFSVLLHQHTALWLINIHFIITNH